MAVDANVFREVFGALPTAVAVVTANGPHGPSGLACNTVAAVSLRPPLLLVCVDRGSLTLGAIRDSGAFVVNYLLAGRGELCDRFAGKLPDKFSGVSHVASVVAAGAPVLTEDSLAVAECVLTEAVETGDHWILIGLIEHATVYGGTPLTYFRRRYDSWPEARPAGSAAVREVV
ncbi:flavin reductase (DIM6/NTAB) family NADH-FMN oxidoreductase RutF [Streptosporangium becharense]|uniref:Flavin reductase (DIM6/NTAB) family NADH-FMN oxidoreductase RutF n=1 Tax=Streptosporangium becharense TaxID=1816182 RepID=A0A7W9MJY5_9ACTN|nr:flavin reductase family protein [Streptosporangium becharense]MBB2910438.1 flavin reductase (DIM6/NTAB) family NADH-FMN oxidoreductase RutF [Streptosporangium becharense]MBB5823181.1 flavin reductase (DIM6/NTAB) family NADH-FMN oxidoreductase RutF [Streptosporangium becharense]